MIRQLLADRFHLVTHATTETQPVYTLELAPGGAKLKPVTDACVLPLSLRITTRMPPDPCGVTIPGNGPVPIAFIGRSISMPYLAFFFETLSGGWGERRAVVDQTGLAGRYDLDVKLDLAAPAEGESGQEQMVDEFQALAKALLQQAGLKANLFSTVKFPLPARVVDAAEMPSN